jgi:cell division protease FtsH
MMGAERRTMAMTDDEKKLTAYHEAGHAIIALKVAGIDPIHKATIIPRGRALGMVMTLPEADSYSFSREKALARLTMLFGGREAEIIKFGPDKVTSGASGDIQMATSPGTFDGHGMGHEREARPRSLQVERPGSVPRTFGDPVPAHVR